MGHGALRPGVSGRISGGIRCADLRCAGFRCDRDLRSARGPLAVRVSGPAGSLPCREEWFGCSGIRNSKFQRRHPASRNPACQQFGIPNSIIGFTGGASETIRSVSGQAGAQPDRVAPPRPWNGAVGICGGRGRLARKGYLPAYLAAFPRGRCPAMLRPEARSGAGVGDGARQGGAIRPRVLCRPGRFPARPCARNPACGGSAADGRREVHPLQETSPPQGLDAAKIVIQPSCRTHNRHPVQNGCRSRPSGGT